MSLRFESLKAFAVTGVLHKAKSLSATIARSAIWTRICVKLAAKEAYVLKPFSKYHALRVADLRSVQTYLVSLAHHNFYSEH
eukprot:329563-Pleurochrysis_carterae.AAC.6